MAGTSGTEILARIGILLNDEDHERWTCAELCRWINEATVGIVLAKPSAKAATRLLTLLAGTLQSVTVAAGAPTPLALLNIVRNITAAGPPRVAGRVVKPTSAAVLDASNPNWHKSSAVPFNIEVRHFIFDEQNPLEFYVYPGNTGGGVVEALCSELPTPITAGVGDVTLAASYSALIDLPPIYDPLVVDYAVYRAQSKDDPGAVGGRAGSSFQQFAQALGLKIQVEGASSPNSRRGKP